MRRKIIGCVSVILILCIVFFAVPSVHAAEPDTNFDETWMQRISEAEISVVFCTAPYADGAYAEKISSELTLRFIEDPYCFVEALALETPDLQRLNTELLSLHAYIYDFNYVVTIAELLDPAQLTTEQAQHTLQLLCNTIGEDQLRKENLFVEPDTAFSDPAWIQRMEDASLTLIFRTIGVADGFYGSVLLDIATERLIQDPVAFVKALSLEGGNLQQKIAGLLASHNAYDPSLPVHHIVASISLTDMDTNRNFYTLELLQAEFASISANTNPSTGDRIKGVVSLTLASGVSFALVMTKRKRFV